MKMKLTHHFSCSPERLWQITESDAFEARLAEASSSARALMEQRREADGTRYLRRRITAKRTLPAPMVKVLGTDQISYDQETWHKENAPVLRWRILPQVLQGRFHGEGTTTVAATAEGCSRTIEGELTIKVPLVGGQMEKKLVEDVSRSYDRAAEIIRQMLREEA